MSDERRAVSVPARPLLLGCASPAARLPYCWARRWNKLFYWNNTNTLSTYVYT